MVETRTGSGVSRRPGRMGADPFARREVDILTWRQRAEMEAFYDEVDARLVGGGGWRPGPLYWPLERVPERRWNWHGRKWGARR